jgi:hypothetical protein
MKFKTPLLLGISVALALCTASIGRADQAESVSAI